jgi:hypothetical protein
LSCAYPRAGNSSKDDGEFAQQAASLTACQALCDKLSGAGCTGYEYEPSSGTCFPLKYLQEADSTCCFKTSTRDVYALKGRPLQSVCNTQSNA